MQSDSEHLFPEEALQSATSLQRAPRIVYQQDLARALGLSPAAISRCAKRGMPTDSVEAALLWRRRNVRQRVDFAAAYAPTRAAAGLPATQFGDASGVPDGADVQTARSRKEAAEAGLAELKLQRAAGGLARIEDVARACAGAASGLRSALEGLVPALAPQLAGREWSEAQIADLLTAEIARLQATVAASFARAARAGRDVEDADDEQP